MWFQRTLSDDAPTTTTRKSSIDDETRAAAAQQITPRASRSFPSPRVSSPRAPRTMAERRRLDAKDRTSLDQQQWRRRSERRKRKRRSAGVEVHRRHRRRLQKLIVREWRRIVHTSHADTARARHREGVQRVASLQHCVRAGVRRVASLQHRVGAHSAAARGVTAAMAGGLIATFFRDRPWWLQVHMNLQSGILLLQARLGASQGVRTYTHTHSRREAARPW